MKKNIKVVSVILFLLVAGCTKNNNVQTNNSGNTNIQSSISQKSEFSITLDGKNQKLNLDQYGVEIQFGPKLTGYDNLKSYAVSVESINKYTFEQYNKKYGKKIGDEILLSSGNLYNGGAEKLIFVDSLQKAKEIQSNNKNTMSGELMITPVLLENINGGIFEIRLGHGNGCELRQIVPTYFKDGITYKFQYNIYRCLDYKTAEKVLSDIKEVIKSIK